MATRQTTEDETPINDVAGIERGEDDEDEEGWEDAEPDVENIEVVSFFSDKRYSSIGLMLEDCKQEHGFDFVACVKDFRAYVVVHPNAVLFKQLLTEQLIRT